MNWKNLLTGKSTKVMVVFLIATIGISNTTVEDDNRYFEITKNIEIFTTLYKEINTYYVDDIDPAKLMRTGIDAMMESLDPYTNYISESEIENFRMMTTGKYGGVGATIVKYKDHVVITEPYEGFSAHNAGLMAGDVILSIDGKSAEGKSTEDVSNILKGAPGTEVTLEIKRPGKEGTFEVNLTREEVNVPNVPYYGMINEDIGYVVLTTFTEQAGKNVQDALTKLKEENDLKGVVLDLRNNGGGLLSEAINLSNVFVDRGEEVVTTRGKIKDWDRNFKTLNQPADLEIPLVVLINKGSASASEIVSGVVQDLDRGVLIGQKSYGKGLVQNTRDVGFNSKVKITTAKYYIPSGRCIQAVSYKDGEPVEIPDSLKSPYKTRNGRPVYDGGGIMPDVKIAAPSNANIIKSLMRNNVIFDFATEYHLKFPTIAPAKEFKLSEADFQDFVKFAQSKDLAYKTDSEKALNQLEKKAKEENYYDAVKDELEAVRKRIEDDKNRDILKYKEDITDLLEREIVSRYYLQKGRIEAGLQNDEEILEAIKVINDPARYKEILGRN